MTCEVHSAAVLDRDGAVVTAIDGLTEVEWGRTLDETATARAFVVPQGDCCAQIANVRTWRHRLVIWRGAGVVFDGPIVFAEWSADGVEIKASDVSAWGDKRLPHQDMAFANTDLCDIAKAVLEDAFLPDDPGILIEIISPALIFGDRVYIRDVDLCLDHVRDLAATGMDWTVAGNRILLFGLDFCESVGSLSDIDFPEGLRVIEDGGALATRWVMWGAIDEAGTILKAETSEEIDPYYGLLEAIHDSQAVQNDGAASVRDQSSADEAIAALLAASSPAPVFIDTGAGPISSTTPVDVNNLIPGYCLEVSSTAACRSVTATQKIIEVKVTEGEEGEQARVVCAPLVA